MSNAQRAIGILLLVAVCATAACGGGKKGGSVSPTVYSGNLRHPPECAAPDSPGVPVDATPRLTHHPTVWEPEGVNRKERFTGLSEQLELEGPGWGGRYPELHAKLKPGDNLIVGGAYMLASGNVTEGGSVTGLTARLSSSPQSVCSVTYGFSGLLNRDRITSVDVFGAGYFSSDDYAGLHIGVARPREDSTLGYYWFGPYRSGGAWSISLHGLGAATLYGETYITLMVYDGDAARIDGLCLRIEEAAL